jgi:methyl-accepting chemotaxis protein
VKNLSKEELLSRLEAINRSNAIIYFDCDGYILDANSIFLETMGYNKNDLDKIVGKHHSIFVGYEYAKSEEYKGFWQKLKSGKFFEGEYERMRVDGSSIYLKASYNPIISNDGTCKKVMKIATDITDTITIKKQVEELSKNLQVELDNSNTWKLSSKELSDLSTAIHHIYIVKEKLRDVR